MRSRVTKLLIHYVLKILSTLDLASRFAGSQRFASRMWSQVTNDLRRSSLNHKYLRPRLSCCKSNMLPSPARARKWRRPSLCGHKSLSIFFRSTQNLLSVRDPASTVADATCLRLPPRYASKAVCLLQVKRLMLKHQSFHLYLGGPTWTRTTAGGFGVRCSTTKL